MDLYFKIAQPIEYYKKFLENDCRPYGRHLSECRPITVNAGPITTAEGSAFVKLGNTSIMCGIKAELAAPTAEEPNKGFIIPNVDLPPLCSPQLRPGPPGELAQTSSHFMQELIASSGCVRPEDLCIADGKTCWVLYCDMICLDYDGNLLDACTLALITALRNVRLPAVSLSEDTGLVDVDCTQTVALKVHSAPVATTFAVFDPADTAEKIVFTDPTSEEESLTSGLVTVVTLPGNQLCMVHKPGGSSLTEAKLLGCIARAHERTAGVCSLINDSVHSSQPAL